MQSYKTSQVGGRASQVGGITCIFKVRKRHKGEGTPERGRDTALEVEAQLNSDNID